jgi:hypothetical protein
VTRRLPPKADRRALLRERGWTRYSATGAEWWKHPQHGRTWFTLAAAYRAELDFGSWLHRQQDRPDPVGDLAREARRDDHWPTQPGAPISARCWCSSGSDEAHAALDSAWSEWQEGRRVCR